KSAMNLEEDCIYIKTLIFVIRFRWLVSDRLCLLIFFLLPRQRGRSIPFCLYGTQILFPAYSSVLLLPNRGSFVRPHPEQDSFLPRSVPRFYRVLLPAQGTRLKRRSRNSPCLHHSAG